MVDPKTDTLIGEKIIEFFNLKIDEKGRINTSWGTKSKMGIGRSIRRIIEAELIESE